MKIVESQKVRSKNSAENSLEFRGEIVGVRFLVTKSWCTPILANVQLKDYGIQG